MWEILRTRGYPRNRLVGWLVRVTSSWNSITESARGGRCALHSVNQRDPSLIPRVWLYEGILSDSSVGSTIHNYIYTRVEHRVARKWADGREREPAGFRGREGAAAAAAALLSCTARILSNSTLPTSMYIHL